METLKSSSRKTAGQLPVRDPAFVPFVTASLEEIRHAERLREKIKERYLKRPAPEVSFRSVEAD
jgi:hypothetical protein